MEVIIGIIGFIIGLIAFVALISIADNTMKTNKLLRLMLNEQNAERFELTTSGKLKDIKTGKKL